MKAEAPNTTKVFLSYSRRDRKRVENLYTALSAKRDLRVFRDTDDILPTEEWKPRLEKLIRESDTIIFALSPHSVASDICNWELELAESLNKRIIPIVIEDVDGNVPDSVSRLNYIFMTRDEDFDDCVGKIHDAVSLDIDWIREHTRLGELADRWEKSVRLGAQPLRGKELEGAENWLIEHPKNAPEPTSLQRQFILNSRRAQSKRQRLLGIGSLFTVAIVGGLAMVAWLQREQAIKNESLAVESAAEAIAQNQLANRALDETLEIVGDMIYDAKLALLNSRINTQAFEIFSRNSVNITYELQEAFQEDLDITLSRLDVLYEIQDGYRILEDPYSRRNYAFQGRDLARETLASPQLRAENQTDISSSLIQFTRALAETYRVTSEFERALENYHELSDLVESNAERIGISGCGPMADLAAIALEKSWLFMQLEDAPRAAFEEEFALSVLQSDISTSCQYTITSVQDAINLRN